MKRIAKITALCLVLFVGCAFTIPAMAGTLESHAASKIKLSKTKATVTKGKTLQLKVKGTKKKVKWTSSKKSVATVSKKGKVIAKKTGKTIITAKVGKKKLKCKITVYPNYKKQLVGGIWQGPWGSNSYVQFEFTKSGHFYFSLYDDYDGNYTEGRYWVKGNKLKLDTDETYTIKSIKNNILTLKTYWGTFKLERGSV
ncbi:Ig-like domain-containing protein [Anaerovorax odorimutans]|uniref:Ig-like domain-containing protein n=1 Tax=Anaerovorax odorimutans TaxID=109327 RepID=A0ABT1RNU7_9FIRM|nr:Ig-like domain-containing protein [Anaerovorax odorimutans]MCQ4636834.1 Ig-like domain-containing protein [Anaerovorax odorimutans]